MSDTDTITAARVNRQAGDGNVTDSTEDTPQLTYASSQEFWLACADFHRRAMRKARDSNTRRRQREALNEALDNAASFADAAVEERRNAHRAELQAAFARQQKLARLEAAKTGGLTHD